MLGFVMVMALSQTPVDPTEFSQPPLVEAPAPDPKAAPVPPPPSASTAPRAARLMSEEPVVEPTTSSDLAGRALMAPVLGAVGATAGGFLGAVVGAFIGLVASGGASALGAVLLAVVGGGLLGAAGMGLGIALGGSLFSKDVRGLFSKTVGWAFAATGIAIVIGLIFLAALPAVGAYIFIGAGVALAACVPLVVEWRRMADAPRAPEPAVTLARF